MAPSRRWRGPSFSTTRTMPRQGTGCTMAQRIAASAAARGGACMVRPSGRIVRCATARRAWLETAGRERVSASAVAELDPRLRSGRERCRPACTPGTRRCAWTLRRKRGRGLRYRLRNTEAASRLVFGSAGACLGRLHGVSGVVLERCRQRESASRTAQSGPASVGSLQVGTTTAGGQRPQ